MRHLLAWSVALWGALAAWGETVQRRTALDTPWKVLPIYGGGFMQNVVIAPSDPNVWYTYVDVGGPYRSDDAGKSWYPLHANLTIGQRDLNAGMVRTLDVDPRDANAFVMAAGDGPWRKGGVFVSRDGGISFRQTLSARYHANGPRRMMGLVLARNPAHPDELVAGSESDGLFLSRDNGETWKNVGLTNHWFSDVRYDATVTNRVWACAPWSLKHDYDAQESYRIRLGGRRTRERGFYRSDDGGETWTRVSAESPYEVRQIRGSDRLVGVYGVFAQVDAAPGAKPLLAAASDDGGATWHDFGEGLRPYVPRGRWSYINEGTYHALAAGPDFWLIGSNAGRIYRRGAKDACWTPVERETLRLRDPKTEGHMRRLEVSRQMEELSTIVVDPRRPDHWLTTDWYFIWETFDAGRNWTSAQTGIMQLVSSCLVFDPFDRERLYYGVADMGYLYSTNGGASYSSPKARPYAKSLACSVRTRGLLYACGGKWETPVWRSEDGGVSWTKLANAGKNGHPRFDTASHGVFTVAVDPVNDDVYVCAGGDLAPGRGGVYRSQDRGVSWEWFSKGLPEGPPLFKNEEWQGDNRQLAFSPDGSAILRAMDGRRFYRLDRAVGAWREMPSRVRGRLPFADPHVPGRFILCGSAMLETLDGGATWHPLKGAPAGSATVAFDARRKGVVVFGHHDALYVSYNGGASCEVLEDGLKVPSGPERIVFLDDGRLFMFCTGSGVFTRPLPDRRR